MIRQLIRFQNMDRRWIFLGMALAIVVPLLAPISFPFKIDERVEAIYEKIEALEPGDTVFISADFDPASRQPIYTILAAEELHETVPMMPRWEPNTANWSIKRGVFRNRFLMDPRTRPPFPKRCQCLD